MSIKSKSLDDYMDVLQLTNRTVYEEIRQLQTENEILKSLVKTNPDKSDRCRSIELYLSGNKKENKYGKSK